MGAVCWECAEDEYLKEIIQQNGKPAECSLCDEECEKAFTAEQLAEVLDPILHEHFALGPDVKKFGKDDEEWWEQEGDSLSLFIEEILGQSLGFEDEIVHALVEQENVWPPDGEIPFFDDSQNYVEKPVRPYEYYSTLERSRRRFKAWPEVFQLCSSEPVRNNLRRCGEDEMASAQSRG